MSGRKSKTKGKAFELSICKFLNKIYDTEEFKRTPSSGSLTGRSNWQKTEGLELHTKNVLSADIISPSWFRCSVECKWYADKPSYHNIIKKNDQTLDGWLSETLRDAINTNRLPVLFFKTNQKGTFVAIPNSFVELDKLSHFANYNGFIIIGIELFELIKDQFKDIRESDIKTVLLELNEFHKEHTEYLMELGK